jgi:CHAD domain-containing protein
LGDAPDVAGRALTMDASARQPEALRLGSDLAVGDGLREMLAGALAALHHEGSGRSAGPEPVHRFRIGLRRLRSILSAFGDVLPERERRALGERLGAAAQRYGRVREWDVFLARTVGQLRKAMPEEPALGLLVERTVAARRLALPPGDTLKAGIAAIEAAVEDAPWLRRPAPALAARWERPIEDYARELLEKRHRKLRREVKEVELADQAAFHELRIRVKKLRYPAELLKSLFDESNASSYLGRLVAMQGVLGSMNDALAGRALVGTLRLPLETQHLVLGWLAHEMESMRQRFPDAAHAFRNAKPFWS